MCLSSMRVIVCKKTEQSGSTNAHTNDRVRDENSPVDAECWFLDARATYTSCVRPCT